MFLTKSLEELETSLSPDTPLLIEQQNILIKSFLIEQLQTLVIKNEQKLFEYVDFCINKNRSSHTKRQTERHHILLKSIFDEYSDLNKYKWNESYLTYEDHYIAHSLFTEAINHNSGIYAWWNMNSQNTNKSNCGEGIVGSERYSELRKAHYDIVSNAQHLRNKTQSCIDKRKETMSIPDENGITEFQRNGQKVSKSLKESGACSGANNSMYDRIAIKERKNPLIRCTFSKDYDNKKFIHCKINYLELVDNTGSVYFRGWKDECIDYCNSIGLDGSKISEKNLCAFAYTENCQNTYLLKLIKLYGLGKYLNSTVRILTDEEATYYIKNKEEFL